MGEVAVKEPRRFRLLIESDGLAIRVGMMTWKEINRLIFSTRDELSRTESLDVTTFTIETDFGSDASALRELLGGG